MFSLPFSCNKTENVATFNRGGTGFALLLLYDLATIGSEVLLSALKYVANLLELSTRKDADSVGATTQTHKHRD